MSQQIFVLEPRYHERVWGGQKLKTSQPPVGEAWIAGEANRVQNGPRRGLTIGELTGELGAELLGEEVARRFGRRFPLLVKLLDCADWLSVQVHPNDAQAEELVGAGALGKTEAWFFLETESGARVLAGTRPDTSEADLAAAIRTGKILPLIREWSVHPGDSLFIPAGTLHALGPGLLLYEVQEASDTTYRVYDWDRPASAGRRLHLDESIAVANPAREPILVTRPGTDRGGALTTVVCPYFELELLRVDGSPIAGDTAGRSFHVVTATKGEIGVATGTERITLCRFETALVAGSAGQYLVTTPSPGAEALRSKVPVSFGAGVG